jgi:hypothetical protein
MRLELINRFALFVCIVLSTTVAGICSDTNSPSEVNDANGPTVILSYNGQTPAKNPFASFMYFVPLISPTVVDVVTSAGNQQQVTTVSYEKKVESKSFYISCEFEMSGNGFHKYIFDPVQVIEHHKGQTKKDESMTNLIDYIIFVGPGLGRIDVRGTIAGTARTVTDVELWFNAKGKKSPVILKRSEGVPRMDIVVASVGDKDNPNGFLGGLKATLANWFIKPPKVAKLGNDTMLDFGMALLEEKPTFAFPRATNIRENKTAPADSKQK